jgi:hypothetical protein
MQEPAAHGLPRFIDASPQCALEGARPGEMNYDDPDFVFAEPDVDHAAQLMRRLVADAP